MPDDQGMSEEWIVRVKGKEYGPADIDTLREWKREGRLLPENEARKAGTDFWNTAAAIQGLFDAEAVTAASAGPPTRPPPETQRRSFGQILGDVSDLSQRLFPISWAYSARIVAVDMQSASDCIDANRKGFGWRFARSRRRGLCLFNVRLLDSDVARVCGRNSNSDC